MPVVYTATAIASGGRDGRVKSLGGLPELTLVRPKEFGGKGGTGTNPEELFAAGFAACFQSSMGFVARQMNVSVENAEVTAAVSVDVEGPGKFGLVVELRIRIPNLSSEEAQKVTSLAKDVCPYSKAIRGNVPLKLTLL